MRASRWGSIAASAGGAAWVASAGLGWGGGQEPTAYLAGLALAVVALGCAGYALVATAPLWLRAVVAVATPLLGLSVWQVLMGALTPGYLPVVLGGVLLLVAGGIGLGRTGGHVEEPTPPPVRGRRAAR